MPKTRPPRKSLGDHRREPRRAPEPKTIIPARIEKNPDEKDTFELLVGQKHGDRRMLARTRLAVRDEALIIVDDFDSEVPIVAPAELVRRLQELDDDYERFTVAVSMKVENGALPELVGSLRVMTCDHHASGLFPLEITRERKIPEGADSVCLLSWSSWAKSGDWELIEQDGSSATPEKRDATPKFAHQKTRFVQRSKLARYKTIVSAEDFETLTRARENCVSVQFSCAVKFLKDKRTVSGMWDFRLEHREVSAGERDHDRSFCLEDDALSRALECRRASKIWSATWVE